jgi:hypothetical protein
MKFKVTKKDMKNGYKYIVSIGYADAEYLLKYKEPFAYSAGINGWTCDYYDIDNILISTGYDPLKPKNTKSNNYNIVIKYDKKAQEILYNSKLNSEEKKARVNALLRRFIKDVIK